MKTNDFVLKTYLCILPLRRHKEEEALQQTVWRVNFSNIAAVKKRTGSVVGASYVRNMPLPGIQILIRGIYS